MTPFTTASLGWAEERHIALHHTHHYTRRELGRQNMPDIAAEAHRRNREMSLADDGRIRWHRRIVEADKHGCHSLAAHDRHIHREEGHGGQMRRKCCWVRQNEVSTLDRTRATGRSSVAVDALHILQMTAPGSLHGHGYYHILLPQA